MRFKPTTCICSPSAQRGSEFQNNNGHLLGHQVLFLNLNPKNSEPTRIPSLQKLLYYNAVIADVFFYNSCSTNLLISNLTRAHASPPNVFWPVPFDVRQCIGGRPLITICHHRSYPPTPEASGASQPYGSF